MRTWVKRVSILAVAGLCVFMLAQRTIIPLVMAQQTKMILVEKSDSDSLKIAYAEFLKASDKWDKAKMGVAKTYVNYGGKPMKGWENVSFSIDFRILVPAEQFGGYGPTGPTGPLGVSLSAER